MTRRITNQVREERYWSIHEKCDKCDCIRDIRYDVDCPKCSGRYTGPIFKAPDFS